MGNITLNLYKGSNIEKSFSNDLEKAKLAPINSRSTWDVGGKKVEHIKTVHGWIPVTEFESKKTFKDEFGILHERDVFGNVKKVEKTFKCDVKTEPIKITYDNYVFNKETENVELVRKSEEFNYLFKVKSPSGSEIVLNRDACYAYHDDLKNNNYDNETYKNKELQFKFCQKYVFGNNESKEFTPSEMAMIKNLHDESSKYIEKTNEKTKQEILQKTSKSKDLAEKIKKSYIELKEEGRKKLEKWNNLTEQERQEIKRREMLDNMGRLD